MAPLPQHHLPKFGLTELTLGRVVGQGGFSLVSEITAVDLDEIYDTSNEETAGRRELSQHVNQHRQGNTYVLKTLRNDLPEGEYNKGMVDLAVEAEFLSLLSHPNIIRMIGMACTDPHEINFFVILEKLTITLDLKFNYWRKMVGQNVGYWLPCYGYCCAKAHVLHQLWKERLGVAGDIARAMQYLHNQGIVYRDLKPDNIGFDCNDTLKIFDFGLAKRLDQVERAENGSYLLTGNTGSLRYMAPEVAQDLPYDLSVDSYSFGILFWQICSLTTPFAGMSQKMHAEKVIRQGQRPIPDKSWPLSWCGLMEDCWSAEPARRPNFDDIADVLSQRTQEMTEEEGVVPTRAAEIRAKKRKQKMRPEGQRLDLDTRLSSDADVSVKRTDNDIV